MNNYTKYPRTFHLPWSPGGTDDDKIMHSIECFEGKEVVVSIKMDGENCTLYSDKIHARSIDSRFHPSRSWSRQLHGQIAYQIPEGWRICSENLFAEHSIKYANLQTYLMVFSVWNEENKCLSWDDTLKFLGKLDLQTVPIIYQGVWDKELIQNIGETLMEKGHNGDMAEGYVVRLAESFAFDDFNRSLAKFVRKGHIQTDQHWMVKEVVQNGLAK